MLAQDACVQILLPGLCDPSAVFIDVGAHIGSVMAAVRAHAPSVGIIAVEADPQKAAYLSRRYAGVEVHGVALGDSDCETAFFVDKRRSGYSSLAQSGRQDGDVVEMRVKMRRLDGLVPPDTKVDVVKIDVEGAELGVLRGATELVTRCRPAILFESGPCETLGFKIGALYDWFADREYLVFVPNRIAHDGPPLSREGFIEAHSYPFGTLNYFGVPGERRRDFRDRARRAWAYAWRVDTSSTRPAAPSTRRPTRNISARLRHVGTVRHRRARPSLRADPPLQRIASPV
jgi:FkbM family methyltransferase